MPNIGFGELIVVLVIALIIFGPGKLPHVGNAIGKAISEFKKASREITKDDVSVEKDESTSDSNTAK